MQLMPDFFRYFHAVQHLGQTGTGRCNGTSYPTCCRHASVCVGGLLSLEQFTLQVGGLKLFAAGTFLRKSGLNILVSPLPCAIDGCPRPFSSWCAASTGKSTKGTKVWSTLIYFDSLSSRSITRTGVSRHVMHSCCHFKRVKWSIAWPAADSRPHCLADSMEWAPESFSGWVAPS